MIAFTVIFAGLHGAPSAAGASVLERGVLERVVLVLVGDEVLVPVGPLVGAGLLAGECVGAGTGSP